MERPADLPPSDPPAGVEVRRWDPAADHDRIPGIFASAFGRPPWPSDWDRFEEFDPGGVFVAEAGRPATGIGFAVCFRRGDAGYISVVAVVPEHRRRGVASALVTAAARRLASLGLERVRIDAYADAPAAVATYRSLGFEVTATVVDEDADPPGTAEE